MQVNLNILGRSRSNIGWKTSNYNTKEVTEDKGTNDEQGLGKLEKAWENV